LPQPPRAWGNSQPYTHPAQGYLTLEFFPDCLDPIPVSGWKLEPNPNSSTQGSWVVVAFRCAAPVPVRATPRPLLSDGSFFLYAERGDLIVEVEASQRHRTGWREWQRYLDNAIALEPLPVPPNTAERALPPIDRKKAEAFLAELHRRMDHQFSDRPRCVEDARASADRDRLGRMIDAITQETVGAFEIAAMEVARCQRCDPDYAKRCAAALKAVERVDRLLKR
jgi:hypothetical protein